MRSLHSLWNGGALESEPGAADRFDRGEALLGRGGAPTRGLVLGGLRVGGEDDFFLGKGHRSRWCVNLAGESIRGTTASEH